ncbi:helix-turn-helix transcriptional regulator [Streptosporangium sp. NPDC001681]|uniref:helix-turn-helix domain-containing protein n=1 Tax=Streptosporangium sp. NPDC001681 TaxID=3154395 RepID=UPI00332FF29F
MPRESHVVDPSKSLDNLFGASLRHWRELRDLRLQEVAKEVLVDLSLLSKWERGERRAPIETVKRLDDLYDAGGLLTSLHELVQVAKSGHSPVAATANVPDPGDMNEARRQLLLSVAGAGMSALLPGLEQLRTIVDRRLGGPDLDTWEEIVWEHAHGIVSRPLAVLIRDLSVDLLTLQQALSSAPGREAVGWARVNARLTLLLAHALGSAGHTRESIHWWISARRAAAQTDDPEFIAAAHAFEAVQALYERRPLAVVLSRVKTALDLTADQPGRAAVSALGSRAHALALMGDHDGAHASLAAQAEVFATLPDSVTGNTMSAEGWSESRLLHTRSLVLTLIGAPSASVAQQEALDSYPVGRERQATQIRLHQAASAVRQGDVTDGLQHAVAIMENLGPGRMTQFVLHVAHVVADAAPAGQQAQRAVSDYRAHLVLTASKGDK